MIGWISQRTRMAQMNIGIARTTALVGLLLASASSASAQREDRWDWSGAVPAGRMLYVRNMNGAVRVEASTGNTVEIIAYKKANRRANPSDVRITVEQRSGRGDVIVCAIWQERQTRCDEDGYSTRGNSRDWWDWGRDDDRGSVSVEFVVRLPRGVRVTASSVNGGIEIDGADSEVDARTTNGSIRARTSGGPVHARTTNGNLDIRVGELGSGSLDYSTTNGQIWLEVPANTNADVELRTVNGSISSDFPLTIEGRFNTRNVRGTIGRGGQTLRLSTTNGSIQLRKG
jgi:hypothetical protein